MKLVKLPKASRVTTLRVSTNLVTRSTIPNMTKIRIKNNTTTMTSKQIDGHKLHGDEHNPILLKLKYLKI
jgi:hypothetical protein